MWLQARPTTMAELHLTALFQAKVALMTQLSNLSNWIDPDGDEGESCFPLRVRYADRGFPETVNTPEDIRQGVSFVVFQTNYRESIKL